MQEVNIYIKTSFKSPRQHKGVIGYVLEVYRNGIPVTATGFKVVSEVTGNQAEIIGLTLATSKINKNCHLTIFTDSFYLAEGLSKWLKQWENNGWKTEKKKDVSNRTEWQNLLKILHRHEFEVVCKDKHEYSSWLESEIAGRKDKL